MASIAFASGPQLLYISGIEAFNANSPDGADPTGLPVSMAFIPVGLRDPVTADWQAGVWLPYVAANPQTARVSVTPSSLGLSKGKYDIWLRVTGATEQPAAKVGILTVT